MAILGHKKALEVDDMWDLSQENLTEQNYKDFMKNIPDKVRKNKQSGAEIDDENVPLNGSVMWPLIKTYYLELIFIVVLKLIASLLTFTSPIVLNWLISFMTNDEPTWKGYFYAVIMFVSSHLESLFNSQYEFRIFVIGMRMRSCIISVIYRKVKIFIQFK